VSRRGDPGRVLGPEFCRRPAERVARDLLGAWLISTVGGETATGRIIETEAYVGPHDPASHAAERIGRTARNAAMFGPPGTAYVYRIYGLHWCLNVVTDGEEYPAAVLIRAIEPVTGVEMMRARRALPPGRPDAMIGRGPGNVGAALGVSAALDRHPLDRPPLLLARGQSVPERAIERGPRVGVSRAREWPLRFWIRGHPSVSRR
jgi:DNA-3-methyladenine glycosylase